MRISLRSLLLLKKSMLGCLLLLLNLLLLPSLLHKLSLSLSKPVDLSLSLSLLLSEVDDLLRGDRLRWRSDAAGILHLLRMYHVRR